MKTRSVTVRRLPGIYSNYGLDLEGRRVWSFPRRSAVSYTHGLYKTSYGGVWLKQKANGCYGLHTSAGTRTKSFDQLAALLDA